MRRERGHAVPTPHAASHADGNRHRSVRHRAEERASPEPLLPVPWASVHRVTHADIARKAHSAPHYVRYLGNTRDDAKVDNAAIGIPTIYFHPTVSCERPFDSLARVLSSANSGLRQQKLLLCSPDGYSEGTTTVMRFPRPVHASPTAGTARSTLQKYPHTRRQRGCSDSAPSTYRASCRGRRS